jgi:hypothetical protein
MSRSVHYVAGWRFAGGGRRIERRQLARADHKLIEAKDVVLRVKVVLAFSEIAMGISKLPPELQDPNPPKPSTGVGPSRDL